MTQYFSRPFGRGYRATDPSLSQPSLKVAGHGVCLVTVDRAALVLTPSCSPQLIGALKRKYDGARVVVVELDDWDFDISIPGPVKRLLDSGVDAYVLADSIDELAQKLATRHDPANDDVAAKELPSTSSVDDIIAAFLRESVEHSTRLQHRR